MMKKKAITVNNSASSDECDQFQRLRDIIRDLRGEPGCPWDKKQTGQSLKKYLLEESNELAEALDSGDTNHVREEIGDIFFILTMLTDIHEEQGDFTLLDVLAEINAKMVRRHPHVYAGAAIGSEEELRRQWESIKAAEKQR